MNTTESKPALPALVSGAQIRAIVPSTFEEAWRIALAISKAGMSPPGLESPEKVTIALMAGLEIGLPPMQAIQSIAVINNRPSLYGDGPIAIVRASGLLESIDEKLEGQGDALTATCVVKRRGEPKPLVRRFSVADAKKAGLWGRNGPWTFYPNRMLAVRARAFALRDGFADVLRGLAIAEEQADIPVRPQPPRPPGEDEIPDFGESPRVLDDPLTPHGESLLEQDAGANVAPNRDAGSAQGSGEVPPTPPQTKDSVAATLAPFRKSEAIGKLLQLATDSDLDEQERLESLDQVWPLYQDRLEPEFCKTLFDTATKVAKNHLKAEAARRFLEGL